MFVCFVCLDADMSEYPFDVKYAPRYVGMVLTMIAYVLTQNSQVYYATLIWTCAALGT